MVDGSGRRGARQRNVLLVDHDSSAATPQQRRLEAHGYHVTKTSDVEAALSLARQAQPQAIFVTLERLGSEHTPFLQALRRDDQTRHIPVTLLPVGQDDPLDRLGLLRVGRDLW